MPNNLMPHTNLQSLQVMHFDIDTPMEKHCRRRANSGEGFSFPITPIQDSDFEFDSPDLASNMDPCMTNSPADHIFFNGILLPHTYNFPSELRTPTMLHISRTTSRASSVNSKDSLLSSRSNSTNSGRSSFSARTSSSDDSNCKFSSRTSSASCHIYGASQRWQIIAPAVLVLNGDVWQKRIIVGANEGIRRKKQEKQQQKKRKELKPRTWTRIFGSFLMACRQFHAMEPCVNDDHVVL